MRSARSMSEDRLYLTNGGQIRILQFHLIFLEEVIVDGLPLLLIVFGTFGRASERVLQSRCTKTTDAIFTDTFRMMSLKPNRFENFSQQQLLFAFVDT